MMNAAKSVLLTDSKFLKKIFLNYNCLLAAQTNPVNGLISFLGNKYFYS